MTWADSNRSRQQHGKRFADVGRFLFFIFYFLFFIFCFLFFVFYLLFLFSIFIYFIFCFAFLSSITLVLYFPLPFSVVFNFCFSLRLRQADRPGAGSCWKPESNCAGNQSQIVPEGGTFASPSDSSVSSVESCIARAREQTITARHSQRAGSAGAQTGLSGWKANTWYAMCGAAVVSASRGLGFVRFLRRVLFPSSSLLLLPFSFRLPFPPALFVLSHCHGSTFCQMGAAAAATAIPACSARLHSAVSW